MSERSTTLPEDPISRIMALHADELGSDLEKEIPPPVTVEMAEAGKQAYIGQFLVEKIKRINRGLMQGRRVFYIEHELLNDGVVEADPSEALEFLQRHYGGTPAGSNKY